MCYFSSNVGESVAYRKGLMILFEFIEFLRLALLLRLYKTMITVSLLVFVKIDIMADVCTTVHTYLSNTCTM